MSSAQKPVFGVLMANLGTPAAPTPAAVKDYLAQFLWDKRVVDVARPLWWLILNGIILRTRPKRVAKAYQSVWTPQGSPLMVVSRAQQQALQEALNEHFGFAVPVALGMSYGQPSMASALAELKAAQVERVLILPLYPQYSSSTTASVYDAVSKVMATTHALPETRWINEYHQHPLYIQALANSVREYRAQHGSGEVLLMSFHGIPQRYEDRGDPYPTQCRTTAKLVAQALGLKDDQWRCSFQSRFGKEEWVKPYTDAALAELAKQGGRVDVLSPAFAADCLETLEELNVENRELFMHNGGRDYHYISCLNERPDHIELLRQLVIQHSAGWIKAD